MVQKGTGEAVYRNMSGIFLPFRIFFVLQWSVQYELRIKCHRPFWIRKLPDPDHIFLARLTVFFARNKLGEQILLPMVYSFIWVNFDVGILKRMVPKSCIERATRDPCRRQRRRLPAQLLASLCSFANKSMKKEVRSSWECISCQQKESCAWYYKTDTVKTSVEASFQRRCDCSVCKDEFAE